MDFAAFTRALRGREPFPWQAQLAAKLVDGDVPDVIDVPTGLGKTSVIDCWAYALSSQSVSERHLPLRLCFVVDRRLIVDSAFEDAHSLERELARATENGGPLRGVAERLSAFTGGGQPIARVRMRGGATWESRWLARPDQPAIVVGTVDQFGSRLLFRGYGTSTRMRPIDAALVSTDCWLVIDEAHISGPLVETTQRVAQLQETVRKRVTRPLAVTAMTATPTHAASANVLRADPDEQIVSDTFPDAAAEARRRLLAKKPVVLVEVPAAKRTATSRDRALHVGEMLARLALRVGEEAQLVGVLCNTVTAARAAHSRLVDAGADVALLIGRCRESEREATLSEWLPVMGLDAERNGTRRYVVATQTIEVGANLDLDAAVCEVASIDALVQRFGRINRSGRREPSLSAIAHCAGHHETDPVYGASAEATWLHLVASSRDVVLSATTLRQLRTLDFDTESSIDFGPLNARRLADEAPPEGSGEPGRAPVLLGSDVEQWARTSPAPEPDQAVAPFIRGLARSAPEVQVAWRARPPVEAHSVDGWRDWLGAARPVEWEFVAVPVWEARALVAAKTPSATFSDQEGESANAEEDAEVVPPDGEPADELLGVAYTDDPTELSPVRSAADVPVGSHLVLRADIGGNDRWGWTGQRTVEGAVPDVGDLAPTRRRGVMRLDEETLASIVPARREEIHELLPQMELGEVDAVPGLLDQIERIASGHPRLAQLARLAKAERWRPHAWSDDEAGRGGYYVLRAPPGRTVAVEATSDADDASTSQAGAPQTLSSHLLAVAHQVRAFADHLGIDEELRQALERAALWHDLGKAEPRFQRMLHDGDELAALLAAEPLAKSGRDAVDPVARLAARVSGVPRGFRHEAVSLRVFERLADQQPGVLADADQELVRHLIASHHGNARPLFPPLTDPHPRPIRVVALAKGGHATREVTVEGVVRQIDWSQPGRFESLCERYGWWGLALLESILRLADMLASETGVAGAREREPAQAAGAAG
jgi:CRISPR-associated endonuclease/helicase Cas3